MLWDTGTIFGIDRCAEKVITVEVVIVVTVVIVQLTFRSRREIDDGEKTLTKKRR